MLKIDDAKVDILILLSSIFWILVVVFCWINIGVLHIISFALVCFIISIYFIVANIKNQKIGFVSPFIYPMFITVILWLIAFITAYETQGKTTYFIIGLHPGQFWVILLQWIGTFLTMVLFYALFFEKHFLTDDQWNSFLKEVEETKKRSAGDR